MKKIAQGYFKSHPSVNSFFFTSDEQAFFTKQAAENHAQSLPKELQDVTEVTRAEAEGDGSKVADQKEKAIEKAKEKVAKAEAKLEEANGKLQAEADDTKKEKLQLACTNAAAAVETAKNELAALEA